MSACCMGIGALKRLGRGLVRTVVLKALVDAKAVFWRNDEGEMRGFLTETDLFRACLVLWGLCQSLGVDAKSVGPPCYKGRSKSFGSLWV